MVGGSEGEKTGTDEGEGLGSSLCGCVGSLEPI